MKNCVDAIVDDNGQTFDHFSFREWLQDGDGAISAAVETWPSRYVVLKSMAQAKLAGRKMYSRAVGLINSDPQLG